MQYLSTFLLLAIVVITGCEATNNEANRSQDGKTTGYDVVANQEVIEVPELASIAGITLTDSVELSRSAAEQTGAENIVVFPFGYDYCEAGACKKLPEIELHGVTLGTPVLSATAGKVVEARSDGEDGAVVVLPNDAGHAVGYDHVKDAKVEVGDIVEVGQQLGEVAPYGNGEFGRVEFFLKFVENGGRGGNETYLCPMDYLSPAAKATVTDDLEQFFVEWNNFIGEDVYDVASMPTVGCVESTLSLEETQ